MALAVYHLTTKTEMVQAIPLERFRKRWKCSDVFLFSHSNRNDRKIPYHLSKSCSARSFFARFSVVIQDRDHGMAMHSL